MNNLIYFSTRSVRSHDYGVTDDEYQYHEWFNLIRGLEWPNHTTSRVHQLNTPWHLAPTVCAIPKLTHCEENFDNVIDSIAEKFCNEVVESGRTPYMSWSGGIDSTSILVSLLKIGNADFLKKLIVLCNKNSIKENPYFYYRFIDQKLQTQDTNTLIIDSSNFDKIVIVDGEAGNQCMGWRSIHVHSYYQNFDFLDQSWRTVSDLTTAIPGSNEFTVQLIKDSIDHAPIDIKTVYDFIWWANFNFKFDNVLIRKVLSYTENLTAQQTQMFYNQSLYRFYAQPNMQIWSMISTDQRRISTRNIVSKWASKNYIYQFDRNDLWYSSKKEEASMSKFDQGSGSSNLIAIDNQWNKYHITNPDVRKTLGKILQRI
jgi:hypothetical protein